MDVVEVEKEEIRLEDFGEGAGWCNVWRTKQADGASESAQKQHAKTQKQAAAASTTEIVPAAATAAQSKRKYARHLQHLAKASRMPELPPDDYNIIVRPRGGFNGAEYGMDRIYCCLRNAAGIGREAAREDSICLNVTRTSWYSARCEKTEPNATEPSVNFASEAGNSRRTPIKPPRKTLPRA
ncbi:hypothetical protein MTO96_007758 [Rhipicephalus appendiculatus]